MPNCLTCNCIIDKGRWCSMDCKRLFLIQNYSENVSRVWFAQHNKRFKRRQKKLLKQIKKTGLSVSEFILSLGDFRDE